jgi:nucleotidyltransferase substrate binding protein (TIGR01987 family)
MQPTELQETPAMTNPPVPAPRWKYRFDNFQRAFLLLREGIETLDERSLSQLEKEGLIQRFEYTWELAWKTLRDFLEAEGIQLETITPSQVIRAGLNARIISDGELWMRALDARNRMSHTYDLKAFEQIIQEVRNQFLNLLGSLYEFFLERLCHEPS